MCAFGIIIGDTIPHVIRSIFPTLYKIPVLGLLTNRQFVIFLCTTCVSYPLSLYRDIHKLSRASGLALISMVIIVASVLVEGPGVPSILKGDPSMRFSFVNAGIFQAIGVISFAFGECPSSCFVLWTPTSARSLSPQFSSHIWKLKDTNTGSFRPGHACIYIYFFGVLLYTSSIRLCRIHRQNTREHLE